MKMRIIMVEENGDENEKITEIAWNSSNFKYFIRELENSGVDKNKIEQIKLWMW